MPKTDSDTETETATNVFDPGAAVRRLSRSEATPDEIEAKLLKLVQTARNRKQEAALLDALLPLDLEVFGTLGVVEAVLMLADEAGRGDEFKMKFDGFRKAGVAPPRWAPADKKKALQKRAEIREVDRSVVKRLVTLKYVQGPAEFATLEQAAEFYAPRVDLPAALVDTLFENRRDRALDRGRFTLRLQQGFAFAQVLADLRAREGKERVRGPSVKAQGDLWTEGAFEPPTGLAGDARRPTLFLTFHGGLFAQAKIWYKKTYPDGLRIGTGSSDKIVSAKVNANGALLEAYRSLAGGAPLLIAADSPLGTAKNLLTVLGREIPVADGFVFLAFESKADVHWLMIVPERGRLTPRLTPGPKREDGEKMSAYRERLIAFVGRQITDYVTGAPEQVILPTKWMELLSGHGEAYKERHYKPGGAT